MNKITSLMIMFVMIFTTFLPAYSHVSVTEEVPEAENIIDYISLPDKNEEVSVTDDTYVEEMATGIAGNEEITASEVVPHLESLSVPSVNEESTGTPIDLTVLENNTDEPSIMENYIEKPAYLKEIDGVNYVTFTLLSSNLIQSFKTQQEDGDYKEVEVLEEDSAAHKRIVQFAVPDLTHKLNARVKVSVPNVYDKVHTIQLTFHTGIEPEVPAEPVETEINLVVLKDGIN